MAGVGARTRWAADALFAVALVALIASAYSPALKHAPRADQWAYLADTAQFHGFWPLLAESYSYNRTRVIGAGDTDLFRPLLFVLLASEKYLFGGDFRFAQGIGIALHCCVCFLLLALLRQIAATGTEPANYDPRADLLPYGVVAFFGLNPYVQELVIWHHLHGYLLFLALLLGSMVCLLRHVATDGEPVRRRWLSGAWVLALGSAFAYELGQVYAVMAGLLLAATAYPRAGRAAAARVLAAFVAIMLIYQTANAVDRRIHEGRYDPDDGNRPVIRERALGAQTGLNAVHFGVYTAVQPFFPAAFRWTYSFERFLVAEGVWFGAGMRTLGPVQVVSYGVFATAIGLAVEGLWRLIRTGARVPILTLLLFTGLYATYATVNIIGRLNVRAYPPQLVVNSYYAYTGLLFVLVCLAAAWRGVNPGWQWAAGARTGLLAGLTALSLAGAEHIREASTGMALKVRDHAVPLRAMQEFVVQHRSEADFSFAIDYDASDPIPLQWNYPITELVFSRWSDWSAPKYRVVVRGEKVLTAPSRSSSVNR